MLSKHIATGYLFSYRKMYCCVFHASDYNVTEYGSTLVLGMTQVVLHYAHIFEICIFHFQFQLLTYQSDPYCHKEHEPKKWLKCIIGN